MIIVSRDVVRRFRTLAGKCVAGRSRKPSPAVIFCRRDGSLSIWTRIESVTLVYSEQGAGPDKTIVMPMSAIADIEGTSSERVELAVGAKSGGAATFTTKEGKRETLSFETLKPGKQHELPHRPPSRHYVQAELLKALHECGRSASRDQGRFILNHLQVRGRAGYVIGTDSKQALAWGGFDFGFSEDILIPAIPVFGARDWPDVEKVGIGLHDNHFVVEVGSWAVFLPVNSTGKYPDVFSVAPKKGTGTVARIDDQDAESLLELLPVLPAAKEESGPVTLDLDCDTVTIRARDSEGAPPSEIVLDRSKASGPGVQVAVARKALHRAFELGCRTLRISSSRQVLAGEGVERLFLAATLDTGLIVLPDKKATRLNTSKSGVSKTTSPSAQSHSTTERSDAVKAHESNGRSHPDSNESSGGEALDALVEAEALRGVLADASARANRLVALLKQNRKEKKALASVYSSLRQLNLSP